MTECKKSRRDLSVNINEYQDNTDYCIWSWLEYPSYYREEVMPSLKLERGEEIHEEVERGGEREREWVLC